MDLIWLKVLRKSCSHTCFALLLLQTIQYITKNKVMETESRELAAVSRGKIKVH